jgi:hypothetical protein
MHYLICVAGFSGTGKDEFCKCLVKHHGAIQIGIVDPAKRHMADVYGFTFPQLFGSSSLRNAGDVRYPKPSYNILQRWSGLLPQDVEFPEEWKGNRTLDPSIPYWWYRETEHQCSIEWNRVRLPSTDGTIILVQETDPEFWLSPREALQKYCTLLDDLYPGTWARKNIRDRKTLALDGTTYEKSHGIIGVRGQPSNVFITCSADCRYWHDVRAARAGADDNTRPVLVRIITKHVPKPPYNHRSETEQVLIPDSEFDVVVVNDGTVEELHLKATAIIRGLLTKKIGRHLPGNPTVRI